MKSSRQKATLKRIGFEPSGVPRMIFSSMELRQRASCPRWKVWQPQRGRTLQLNGVQRAELRR